MHDAQSPECAFSTHLGSPAQTSVAACAGSAAGKHLGTNCVQPVADQYVKVAELFIDRHASAKGTFKYLAAFRGFSELHAKLSAEYSATLLPMLHERAEDGGATDCGLAVSSAMWALLELCKLNVQNGQALTASTSDWALWNDAHREAAPSARAAETNLEMHGEVASAGHAQDAPQSVALEARTYGSAV